MNERLMAEQSVHEINGIQRLWNTIKQRVSRRNLTRVGLAAAFGLSGARSPIEVHAQTSIFNKNFVPALELNTGHIHNIEALKASEQNTETNALNELISGEALNSGIIPKELSFLRVDSDASVMHRAQGRGGEERGGYVVFLTDAENNNYIVGQTDTSGHFGVIKSSEALKTALNSNDPDGPKLSLNILESEKGHEGYLFVINGQNGLRQDMVQTTDDPMSKEKKAELIVVEGYNNGKPIERAIPFTPPWIEGELASLDIPPGVISVVEQATATPVEPTSTPEQTFEQMEISTDPDHLGSCTYDDITSGRLTWNEKRNFEPFPDTVINNGWDHRPESNKTDKINLIHGGLDSIATRPEKIVSMCTISADFLGKPNETLVVIGFAVRNVDGSVSVLHIVTANRQGNSGLRKILNRFPQEQGMGFVRWADDTYKNNLRNTEYWWWPVLYDRLGQEKLDKFADDLIKTGIITPEMETTLFLPGMSPW